MNLTTFKPLGLLAATPAAVLVLMAGSNQSKAAEVIELTQTGCQFVESENGVDHGFQTLSADDCKRINADTGSERLEEANVLTLQAGTYVFRVANQDVPYELGFWLRESSYQPGNPIHKLSKTSVSGGGITEGTARDYEVELKPGSYLYSCPLNPTPDYALVVKANE